MATARSSSGPFEGSFQGPEVTGADPGEVTHIHLRLSPEMSHVIEGLMARTGLPKADLFNMAIGFLKTAADAVDEGKRIGIASDGQDLEVEFTGL